MNYLLPFAFIAMFIAKCLHYIDWSWWIVFSPMIVLAVFVALTLAFASWCISMAPKFAVV